MQTEFQSPDALHKCVGEVIQRLRGAGLDATPLEKVQSTAYTTGSEWLGELGQAVIQVERQPIADPATANDLRRILAESRRAWPSIRRGEKARKLLWLPPIGWAATIFTLSCLSFGSFEPGFAQEDKVFHSALFSLLSMFFFLAFFYERRFRWAKAAVLAFLITSAYGAVDEFHQRFTPNRTCDVRDWMADTVGAAVVVLTFSSQRRKGAKNA